MSRSQSPKITRLILGQINLIISWPAADRGNLLKKSMRFLRISIKFLRNSIQSLRKSIKFLGKYIEFLRVVVALANQGVQGY